MSGTTADLEALKQQYEAALVNEAHAEWTLETSSVLTRLFNHDQLLHEDALRQQFAENARLTALKIHAIDPRGGMQTTTDIERDVKEYMEKRKSDYDKAK